MIPSVIASEIRTSVSDFLKTTFNPSTPGFTDIMSRFLKGEEACFKGPYLSIGLPFRPGTAGPDYFPAVPMAFPPHNHQQKAFDRLKSPFYQPTLIATGTGSGKTECFLQPILDHCHQHRDTPGIKALLIYPMNALATDQAKRIAKAIYRNPVLNGHVTAGLFVGESDRQPKMVMSEAHIITDKELLRHSPPDILLTNYKMLDYLLLRPRDKRLWSNNQPDTLRYLVVDEIHTFDGAQGTDLACLIRRLKARLGTPENHLACVGTSATLGGPENKKTMASYANRVFGEKRFGSDSIIEEDRLSTDEFVTQIVGHDLVSFLLEKVKSDLPGMEDFPKLDSSRYNSLEDYLRAQHQLWLGRPIPDSFEREDWRIALGGENGLITQRIAIDLVRILETETINLTRVWEQLSRKFSFLPAKATPEYKAALLDSLLALMAVARRPRPAAANPDDPLPPWVNLRIQFWQRELRRMVATVEQEPKLVFADDQSAEMKDKVLPVLNCRECGNTGWGAVRKQTNDRAIACDLKSFYVAYFANNPLTTLVYPIAADADPLANRRTDATAWSHHRLCTSCLSLNNVDNTTCTACGHDEVIPVIEPSLIKEKKGKREARHDCPFCGASNGLSILGSRAASLASVVIGTLFGSAYNSDRKLITFSDSVQDAAHRAGFFGARTFRTTLRTALYQYLAGQPHPQPLNQVVTGFQQYWNSQLGDDASYIATFIPTDLQWLNEWRELKDSHTVGDNLKDIINKRIDWEIVADLGLRSTIGRTLEKMGACAVRVDPDRLDGAIASLLPKLQNEIGDLHNLDPTKLRRFLLGLLRHLRQRGGILHTATQSYIEQNGQSFKLQQPLYMPGFGPNSRLPIYLSDKNRGRGGFEQIIKNKNAATWCYRWAFKSFFDWKSLSLVAEQFPQLYQLTLEALVNANLLDRRTTRTHQSVWGLRQESLFVQTQTVQLNCDRCHDSSNSAPEDLSYWSAMPCLQPHCDGHYQPSEQQNFEFYKNLYSRGEVWRIFAQEHTGLLEREVREQLEDNFIHGKHRYDPNLLSATSTLEMGIDIGDLSSTLLCSVPPTQANYQQRIGRAGRRDGNAFVGAIANGRPHDLYFWSDPLEKMILGGVEPPGFYLDASAILQRQLAAFCLDSWIVSGTRDLPEKFSPVLTAVKKKDQSRFPYTWLDYIGIHQTELLNQFLQLFEKDIAPRTQAQLQEFIEKGDFEKGGLRWRILDRIQEVVEERNRLKNQVQTLGRRIKEKENGPKGQDHEESLDELRRERSGLSNLVTKINAKRTLEFFTDEGLLPNYAFPEAGVTLKSIIWRKRESSGNSTQGKFVTETFEYERPGAVAIGELVPAGSFYAEGRRVDIDQIDLNLSKIEDWRFCRSCAFAVKADLSEGKQKTCPRCNDVMWSDAGRKRKMVRLRQVMATTSDRNSRIGDDRDDRAPAFFTKQMLTDFDPISREETYVVEDEDFPFGFEFIAQAQFREVNFGEAVTVGEKLEIAGVSKARSGFKVCRHCGKVQPKNSQKDFKHSLACNAPNKQDEELYADILYLFRQFESEALRILMPVDVLNFPERLHSFIAALQLGLKHHYQGSVDHLRVLISEEPQPNSSLRRPYLFLYDTVPGGTGYLKQLLRNPEEFMSVLQKALDITQNCGCEEGCYNCLFAYRNSFNQDKTSRTEAVNILNAVLSRRSQLKLTDNALSAVKLNSLFDSVLEHKFIEALRRYRYNDRPTTVNKELVNGKSGYFVRIGEQDWNVEPQVMLDYSEGVAVPSKADFVFWPAKNAAQLKPIAVFTDGWEYHRDRLGKDFLQRMAIAQSNQFRIWSLSWSDVESQLDPNSDSGYADLLNLNVSAQFEKNKNKLYEKYDAQALRSLTSASSFEWLTHYLASPNDRQWQGFALVRAFAQIGAKAPLAEQLAQIETWLGEDALAQIDIHSSDRRWSQLQWHSPDGIALVKTYFCVHPAKYQKKRKDSVYSITWIDDRDVDLATPALNQAWSGVLRQFNLFQFLQYTYVLSETSYAEIQGQLSALFPPEVPLGAANPPPISPQWSKLIEYANPESQVLLVAIAQANWPIPELGYELEDADEVAVAEAELAWPDYQVALLSVGQDASEFESQGWHVQAIAPLITAFNQNLDHQSDPLETFRIKYLSSQPNQED